MVYNGTMRGINTLMIMGRDSIKIILRGRIREGRRKDFPKTLEPFEQSVYQKHCKLETAVEMGEHKSPKVDRKSHSPFSRVSPTLPGAAKQQQLGILALKKRKK